jgi:hypothetical protein
MADASRRLPAPWRTEKVPGGYILRDATGSTSSVAAAVCWPPASPLRSRVGAQRSFASVFAPKRPNVLLDRRRPKNLSSFGAKNPRLPVKPEMQLTGKG